MRQFTVDVADEEAARSWARDLGVPYRDERSIFQAPVTSEAAKKKLGFLPGLLLVAVALPALFAIALGKDSLPYAIAFTAFLILLLLALRYAERARPDEHPEPYTPRRFDFLGAIWLLSIPFGPLVGWVATEHLTAGNWQIVAGTRVISTILVPVICVLPLLLFVLGRHALAAGLILSIGTTFPFVTGLGSAFDLVYGPAWEDVEVTGLRAKGVRLKTGSTVNVPAANVELSDGRVLRPVPSAPLHRGPMRTLVLRGLKRIIDAQER